MVDNPPRGHPRISPHLFYDDLPAAMDWLVEAFGCVVRLWLTNKAGTVRHGELEFEDGLVLMGRASEHDEWESPRSLGDRISQRLLIFVEDVDAHYERSRRSGARILYPPFDEWYGDRVYECADPEGHRWKFAQHIRDVDVEYVKTHYD